MTQRNLMKRWLRMLVWAVAVCAAPAFAERDTFYLGNGTTDPALSVSSGSNVINSYQQVGAPLAAGDTTIPVTGAVVGNARGFKDGDLVMVLQTTGFIPVPSTGLTSKDISADPVGRWEFARLKGTPTGTSLPLSAPLINSYAASVTQVIRVPEYPSVTITGGSIVAAAWDGNVGGVLAFLSTGAVSNAGAIRAIATGFRGGTYNAATDTDTGAGGCFDPDQAPPKGGHKGEGVVSLKYGTTFGGLGAYLNGGGGGVCLQSGGGGGGNGGQGGRGGFTDASDGSRNVGGQGGSALAYGASLNHLTLGGGGGVGHSADGNAASGGNGGGIIFFRAASLSGSGSIQALGASPGPSATDAASGGGAGGTVYIRLAGAAACAAASSVAGGVGGNSGGFDVGPGGGGGGGQVIFQACGTVSCTINRGPGSPGSQGDSSNPNYGATAGSPGTQNTISGCFTEPTVVSTTLSTPANNSFTNNRRPIVSGTGPANTLIAVYVDGVEIGSVTSDASGNWSLTPGSDLAIGARQISARAEVNGVMSAPSTRTVTIDVTPPAQPSLLSPTSGTITNNNRIPLSGTAEAGSRVDIYVDGKKVGSTTADSSGNWSYTPAAGDLPDGVRSLTVNATDAAGNTSVFSPATSITVDTTPPPAPSITSPTDGTITNNNRIPISGTAEANSQVDVYVDGAKVGFTTANSSGAWTYTPGPSDLPDGARKVKVTATDAAGNTSPFSNQITINVDTLPPPAPVVSAPVNGSYTHNTFPVYSGTAEANITVVVVLQDPVNGTVTLGSTTADGSGNWTLNSPSSLNDGTYKVYAYTKDTAGNQSVNSNTNTFTVDTVAPGLPVITAPANGSTINTAQPTFRGTAEPLSTVTLYLDGSSTPLGTASVDASGNWSFPYTGTPLGNNTHFIRAEATDLAGNLGSRTPSNSFTVDTFAPAAPVVEYPLDGQSINTQNPTIRGTSESGATVEVVLDGVSLGTTTADSSGNWSLAYTGTPLSVGTPGHTVSARATDAVGNVGSFSTPNTFYVDITAPNPPVVVVPANGAFIKDLRPRTSGTAEPFASVTITFDNDPTKSATTTADMNGDWAISPTFLVGVAGATTMHTVSAVARDAAGNVSGTSAVNTFVIDTQPPSAPTVLTPASGSTVYTARPLVMGSADPGTRVDIYIDGVPAGFTTAGTDGSWSVPVGFDLTNGSHFVEATSTDAAGNISTESPLNLFTVDLTPPDTTITDHPTSVTRDTSATFKFESSKPSSTFECSVDSAAFVACVNPVTLNNLGNGPHTFSVRATDAGGHVDSTPATFSWTVDLVAPNPPAITTPTSGSLVTPTPTLSGTAEPGSTVTVYVDNNPVGTTTAAADGTWSFTLPTALGEGTHTLSATATDPAGNASARSGAVSVTVDNVPPDTTLTRTPDATTASGDATFEFTSEAGATFECSLDDAAFAACTSPTPYSNLANGSHTFQVRARDQAGNVDPTPARFSWTVNRVHESRFAGGGLGGCSAAGGESGLALLSVLGLLARAVARRRAR